MSPITVAVPASAAFLRHHRHPAPVPRRAQGSIAVHLRKHGGDRRSEQMKADQGCNATLKRGGDRGNQHTGGKRQGDNVTLPEYGKPGPGRGYKTGYNLDWLLSASGVMEARGGGFGYDDGSRRSAVAGEHEGFLSSWPQRTRSTSHPCSMTRNASPWCASTAGQRASVALDAAATR